MEREYWVKLKEELSVSINEWEQVINEWNVCILLYMNCRNN